MCTASAARQLLYMGAVMLSFLSTEKRAVTLSAGFRYGVALLSVTVAFFAIFVLRQFNVRDPFASVFLTAIAVSFLYGGTGPGVLAITLSTLGLQSFLHTPGGWLHVAVRDLPVFCTFLVIGVAIYRFNGKLRRAEQSLQQTLEELETTVSARTAELTRVNSEYKALLDAAPFGIALLAPGRILQRCNRAYEKMLGVGTGELIGRRVPLPESEKETWERQEERLRAGEQIVDYKAIRLRNDGSEFAATISAMPLNAEGGSYMGVLGVIMDDTERNEQEAERQMLTAMAEHSPDVFAMANLEGAAQFVNKAGQVQFGLDGAEHVKRTNVLEYFAEEERARARDHLIPKLIRDGQLEFETMGRNFRTGKTFPLYCNCFVIPDARTGAPSRIAAVARDITERRRADEEKKRHQEQTEIELVVLKERNLHLARDFSSREMFTEIIGSSPALIRTLDMIEGVARTDSTVLITGETGTGKELVARAIHMASRRSEKPFIAVPCVALVPSLIASELFGHERGAFTGAERQRPGRFELADGGTIFLDEIGDIPEEIQVILLRVLQERQFERIGGSRPIHADVRVLAATNRDLRAAVEKGVFRRDLFYRLNGYPIEVPPLRERKEDIPPLVWHFVEQSSRKLGKGIPKIEKRSMERLQAWDWPGNIRELQNFIDKAMIEKKGDILVFDERALSRNSGTASSPELPVLDIPLAESRMDHDKKRISDALTQCSGQIEGRHGAAALLGMRPSTLRSACVRLGIEIEGFRK